MSQKVDKRFPVMFQKLDTYENQDTRFMPVKIWLMHLGENYNGSYFSKEVVEQAIDTLADTPILGYLEDNSNGETDFSDHRMVIVKEDGEYKTRYIGQAFGTISKDNHAKFEKRVGDDGVEREYLTIQGLLWTKWDTPIDILNHSSTKSQSMELHDDYEGEWNKKDGLFHFTKISFYGACILGEGVLPAMNSASIEKTFSYDQMREEINQKLEEFKAVYAKHQTPNEGDDVINSNNKEGEKMDEKMTLLEKFAFTVEQLQEKGIEIESISVEELETKLGEFTATNDADNKPKGDFALTASQLVNELRNELAQETDTDSDGYTYQEYWYVDHMPDQSIVIVYDIDEGFLVGFPYIVSGDTASVDFNTGQRYKMEYLPMNIPVGDDDEGEGGADGESPMMAMKSYVSSKKAEFEQEKQSLSDELSNTVSEKERVETEYAALEEEVSQLRDFKESKIAEEREVQETELFENFANQLTDEELAPVRDKASKMSIEDLEKELFSIVGRKTTKFSTTAKKEKNKIPVDNRKDDSSNKPSYMYILEKHVNK